MTKRLTGITVDERFEIIAEVFYAETGYLAPGKDAGAMGSEDYDQRRKAAWGDFMVRFGRTISMTIEAANKVL